MHGSSVTTCAFLCVDGASLPAQEKGETTMQAVLSSSGNEERYVYLYIHTYIR